MNPLLVLAAIGAAVVAVSKLFDKSEPNLPTPNAAPVTEPRAFISFDFDNNLRDKNLFAGQLRKSSPTPFSAQDWSSKEALPQADWEKLIFEKIGRCHIVLVLVSPTAHNAAGVAKEIAMAIKQNVPCVGVRVAGADENTPLPKGLSGDRTVAWEWKAIARVLRTIPQSATPRF